ncbi:unnamed protein product [Tilletia controversa]|uniref:Major facilitator superfamily (MFS) profile domain-containing protein n=1 Tax=Tilletia controversa TaxID=13291 RepID=A0A8X7SYC2_9BASI|nr:hypothetical protein CF328_g5108 [Tilletia controversa]KAE8250954.1 hypothetical protein A4X06_0g2876 [Tilletia controversa]CAD6921657.1 unnamed protein product [Tilletia controversa]CAD6926356.1 unnamed protein product [Tilletia controversa]CAD6967150.1 unnamed protein product [Tilletia controversa]
MSSATEVLTPPAGTDVEKQPSSPASQSGSFTDEKKQSSEVSPSAEEYPTGVKFALICLACALFVFIVAIDQTIVSTAIPVVTNQFNSFSDVGWYGSAYLLTSTAFQPLFGRLYANFSVKWIYLVSFAIFEVGSLICALATDSPMFIVGRAIAGLGLAGGYSGSLIIITMIAPLEVRPLLTSAMGAVYGVGGTIGPIIGGALTSKASWRWCFWLNLFFIPPVGFLIAVCLRLPSRKAQHTPLQRLARIDWLGTALILCSVICLLLVCQWGGITYAWADSRIIGLIIGFVVIGLAFCADQIYQGERATIPLRILKNRTVGFGSLVNFCVAAAYFSLLYFLPIYFQSVQGSSAIRSGVQTLPFIVGVIFSVMTTGIMVNLYGLYIPYLITGTALLSIGSGALYLLRPDSSQATWVGLQFLAGIGPGMAWMLPFIAASSALAPEDIELGSAIVIFFQTLGGTIFVSVAQSVFQNKFLVYLKALPNVDAGQVISHGLSAFRAFTSPEDLPAVLDAANQAINKTYLISAVLGALAFISVFGMELNRRVPIGGASFAA